MRANERTPPTYADLRFPRTRYVLNENQGCPNSVSYIRSTTTPREEDAPWHVDLPFHAVDAPRPPPPALRLRMPPPPPARGARLPPQGTWARTHAEFDYL